MTDHPHKHAMPPVLLTTMQMAAADQAAIAAGGSATGLMERAGLAVANEVSRLAPNPARSAIITIICGPGNNGGDGLVAGRILRERGRAVRICLIGEKAELSADAAEALARWNGSLTTFDEAMECEPTCIVDALFGAGLSRPLAGAAALAVQRMNQSERPIVSVDVPSGLDGNTGRAEGAVVQATETVTFFRRKPGHLLLPGCDLCGKVTVADIGISDAVLAEIVPRTFANEPDLWRHAWPRHGRESHKYTRGSMAVVAGGIAGVGAPRLSARAALRIGAGLVTIHCAPSALATHAARGPDALMQRALRDAGDLGRVLDDGRLRGLLIGPALGTDARAEALVGLLARQSRPVVFDADALTMLAAAQDLLAGMHDGGIKILTPHEGEFQRLFGKQPAVMDHVSKLERARAAASLCGATIVYKGADTVIAAPDGRAAINATGSAALGTAGSGDVLGGMIAGLLAQGMPAFEAASAAVWLHGAIGETLGFGLIADDLVDAIPAAVRRAGLSEP